MTAKEGKARPARGLGRGLDALFPVSNTSPRPAAPPENGARKERVSEPRSEPSSKRDGPGEVFRCGIEKLKPMAGQPRHHFDPQTLSELAASIKNHGLIEPLVVRQAQAGDGFEIIAGERRWRAAQRAGLLEVLVVVREVSSPEAFELALVENAQREDLDPIELAEAFFRLGEERGYTQEQLAERVGKDRSTVANAMRLLKLPPSVRALVARKSLSEGHARALLGISDPALLERIAQTVVSNALSVRQTEALVRARKAGGADAEAPGAQKKSPGVRDLENRLARKLGARCEVRDRSGKGELRIHYSSLDELDRLIEELL